MKTKTKKLKTGPKPSGRSHIVYTRLYPKDCTIMKKLAKKSGISLSGVVAKAVTNFIQGTK